MWGCIYNKKIWGGERAEGESRSVEYGKVTKHCRTFVVTYLGLLLLLDENAMHSVRCLFVRPSGCLSDASTFTEQIIT